jgi:Zn ribbon nucleic-acid-binding protein
MSDERTCPKCQSKEYIGIEIRGVYDGVLFWRCQSCGHEYHRWDDALMRGKANRYINRPPAPEDVTP